MALAAVCAAVAAAGCGSDEEQQGAPIPAETAAQLQQRLDVVERQFEVGGGACKDLLEETFPIIEDDLRALPEDLDPDVRRALEDSFNRLRELASSECDEEKGEETTPTETVPTETVPPETVPPETVPTETVPPETEGEELEEGPGQGQGNKKPKKNQGSGQGTPQDGGQPAPGNP